LGELDILKLTKTPLTVFHVSIWGLGALFGGLSPPKPPCGDGTGSEQCRIEFNLHIPYVFELSRDTCSHPLAPPSLSPWISLALLKLNCVPKHTSLFQNLFDFL